MSVESTVLLYVLRLISLFEQTDGCLSKGSTQAYKLDTALTEVFVHLCVHNALNSRHSHVYERAPHLGGDKIRQSFTEAHVYAQGARWLLYIEQ